MRVKSHWFKEGSERGPEELAGAMGFIIWRVAQNTLKRMRGVQFDIEAGPQYFAFMSELLAFLIQIADRIAYERMEETRRVEFTTALAKRVADITDDNQTTLLGAAATASHRANFIALLNARAADYAAFGFDEDGPDYGFVRYLGNCVEDVMTDKDRTWTVSQVMEVEAPEAVSIVRASMADLLHTGPRTAARRARMSGD